MLALWPDEQDTSSHSGDEVMGTPPALDAGSVHLQYRLAYGQRAVVPDQEEYERQFQSSAQIRIG